MHLLQSYNYELNCIYPYFQALASVTLTFPFSTHVCFWGNDVKNIFNKNFEVLSSFRVQHLSQDLQKFSFWVGDWKTLTGSVLAHTNVTPCKRHSPFRAHPAVSHTLKLLRYYQIKSIICWHTIWFFLRVSHNEKSLAFKIQEWEGLVWRKPNSCRVQLSNTEKYGRGSVKWVLVIIVRCNKHTPNLPPVKRWKIHLALIHSFNFYSKELKNVLCGPLFILTTVL